MDVRCSELTETQKNLDFPKVKYSKTENLIHLQNEFIKAAKVKSTCILKALEIG